jgi:hypothetical protein
MNVNLMRSNSRMTADRFKLDRFSAVSHHQPPTIDFALAVSSLIATC